MVRPAIDELIYPPFTGFPPQAFTFMRKLRKNNNRPWFLRHKQEYLEFVRFPMECLVAELGRRMADAAPELEFHPKRSIFRIYRDVRFSKNKAPFKTNIAASFDPKGRRPIEMPGLYVGVEPGEVWIGGGLYMPSGEQVKAIRKAMVSNPDEFLEIVEDPAFRKGFKRIQGEELQKAPLGYPKDHPMIQYLKLKQFYIGREFADSTASKSSLVDLVTRVFLQAMPFIRWLNKAVVRGQ